MLVRLRVPYWKALAALYQSPGGKHMRILRACVRAAKRNSMFLTLAAVLSLSAAVVATPIHAASAFDSPANAQTAASATSTPVPQTWARRGTGQAADTLLSVACPTKSICIAVGMNGAIMASADGGVSWSSRTGTDKHTLWSISCPTRTICWAAGDGGTIISSGDGGATWGAETSGASDSLLGITCPTVTSCLAVGAGGSIRATVDGGKSWSGRSSPTALMLLGVTCRSGVCIATGDAGTVAHPAEPR